MAGVCLQVCVSCESGAGASAEGGAVPAGRRLYEALLAAAADIPDIDVAPVDCFAVCDRPVTLAFRAGAGDPERWSYLIGDADSERDLADILAAARAIADSPYGVPAMDDRPPLFRQGVIARVPPQPGEIKTP
jgi:predicted metal-binding protein